MLPACLPPRDVSRPKVPPAGHLFELFQRWTPDRILVTNPAKLYRFPN
jgi:hypothetical protein